MTTNEATADFALTDTEVACGVTMSAVKHEAARALYLPDSGRVMLADNIAPAVAGAAARLVLGAPARFRGMTSGYPVYERDYLAALVW